MKLKIGRYAVEIMAQRDGEDKTGVFLNEVMLKCIRAADTEFAEGFPALGRESAEMGHDIYVALDAVGLYDALK